MNRAVALPRPRSVAAAPVERLWTIAALHVAGALAMWWNPLLATAHALGTTALGVRYAIAARTAPQAVYLAAYAAASDVLWRMTGARVFWEMGKYASTLILLIVLVVNRTGKGFKVPSLAYFALLLPSCILTVQAYGLGDSRGPLSFNLSGPFALAVGVAFFSSFDIRRLRLDTLLQHLLWPVVGIFTLAFYNTATAADIDFTPESNLITSGNFGPNQVSAILGLGVLLTLLLALHCRKNLIRWTFLLMSAGFAAQALLTFSRGGIFNVALCVGILSVHYVQHRRLRVILLGLLLVLLTFGSQFLLPRLDDLTGGTLKQRYSDLDTTGRDKVIRSDLEIWGEHPLLGVGPGLAAHSREGWFGFKVSPHTEYTRLVAEHGTLGAVSLLILLGIVFVAYQRAPHFVAKSWVAVLAGWSLAAMAHTGMRFAAISFLIGLATVRWSRPR